MAINHLGHTAHGGHDLILADDTMMQPIRDMLRANAAGGAVFHQAHIVNVWHFRAANTLIHPTHNIAQNPLGVIVQFTGDLVLRPTAIAGHWNIQQTRHIGTATTCGQFLLHRSHIHAVIMGGVQGRSSRAWNPSAICTRPRMLDLLLEHRGHGIGHGPHPLADLRATAQPAFQTNIHILVFIGGDP